jgi:hypothetical protein
MVQQGAAIKSSGAQLKTMLRKTGRSMKGLEGVEKLDLLQAMTEQIKEKISLGQKMHLTLSELNAFLESEGFTTGTDAKSAIKALWEMRQLQLTRLAGYVGCKSSAEEVQWLVVLPGHKVSECFSMPGPDENSSPQACNCAEQTLKKAAATVPSEPRTVLSAASPEAPVSTSMVADAAVEAATISDPGDSSMLPIQSSGTDLMKMLQKTGHSLKTLGAAEKLDILNLVAEQVKEKVRLRQRMMLTLSDLNAFLELEGLPQSDDAKEAIELLLKLRQCQLVRLGRYAAMPREETSKAVLIHDADDERFKLTLAVIPTSEVRDCFAQPATSNASDAASQGSSKRKRNDTDDVDIVSGEERPTAVQRYEKPAAPPDNVRAQGVALALDQTCAAEISAPREKQFSIDSPVQKQFSNDSLEAALSPDLKALLAEHTGITATVLALEGFLLQETTPLEMDHESFDLVEKQLEAAREVDRIIATHEISKVLAGDTVEEQRREFQRIAKLLHPDKGFTVSGDARSNLALRLLLSARKGLGGD